MTQHGHRADAAGDVGAPSRPSDRTSAALPAGPSGGVPRRRGLGRGAAAVGLVLGLSGLLFTVNARSAGADTERHPQDLRELTQKQAATVERLSGEVDALRSEVETLTAAQNALSGRPAATPAVGDLVASGSVPVRGEALVVTLDDAPPDVRREDVNADLLVVHQQDIQSVMNALWAGGAEAMGLMDQRVVSTTGVQCQGNVLRLHGRMYSPPFVITAVGDPERLRAALDADTAVRSYVRDAGELGLGWHLENRTDAELPSYSGATELTWAQVPPDVEVLPGYPHGGATSDDTDSDTGTDGPAPEAAPTTAPAVTSRAPGDVR